jgi:hypothetical protein
MPKRVPVVARSRRGSFGCTTVGGGSSAWSWGSASRWRCPGSCGGAACVAASGSRITRLFALPHKRFVQQPVLEKASEYLGTDQSYRKTVQHEGMPIVYDDRTARDKRVPWGLAPSTLWRWMLWLGGMPGTLRAAWKLIREKEPNSTLHREAWAVPPTKYRSLQRRDALQRAMQVLVADRVCHGLFGEGIFPRYATSGGGP